MLPQILLLLAAPLLGSQDPPPQTSERTALRLGLTSLRGEDVVDQTWRDAVEQLEQALAPMEVEPVPLPLDEVISASREGRVDVVLHHPLIALQLEFMAGGRQLLSMRRRMGPEWVRSMGSVVFTRIDHPGSGDLSELIGQDVAAVAPNSFGGWLIARHTLHRMGIEMQDLGSIDFTALPHDRVVERVLSGQSDYGVVRSGVLESLWREGVVEPGQLRVLDPQSTPGFTQITSTPLMPEFCLVALPGLGEELARRIALGLLSIETDGHLAWSVPRDLSSVRELMADLELPPYAPTEPPPLTVQILEHPWTPAAIGLGCALAALIVTRAVLLRAQTRALEASLSATEELHRTKADFLANMSHEIRTPMTAITGYAELLSDPATEGASEERRLEAARTIDANCRHLLAILDDILDMSKLDAGRVSVESIAVQPAVLAREALELLRQRAEGQGLELRLEVPDDLPGCVASDPTRLRQILLNLLGNAVKFTEVGAVTVRVRHDAATQRLELEVADTGIGMTAEQVAQLSEFRPFEQADTSTTRTHGGTGLGLSICAGLARLMGGGLEIESERGQGTTVRAWVEAPARELARVDRGGAPGSPEPAVGDDVRLDGVRVLVVDDGPDNRRLVGFLLSKAGAAVETAEHGAEAVERLLDADAPQAPDVVLMDMQMPVLDGYEATRELRRRGYGGPIVALTAHALPENRQRCIDAGCDDFTTKPVDRRALIALCAHWAAGRTRRSA